jgi:adenine deaminase
LYYGKLHERYRKQEDSYIKLTLKNILSDTVTNNGRLFKIFTSEFIKQQSISIKDGLITYVGTDHDSQRNGKTKVTNADGRVLLPGLTEVHIHLNKSAIE